MERTSTVSNYWPQGCYRPDIDHANSGEEDPVSAVAFDAFRLDPRSVDAPAETLFPGKGAELTNARGIRQSNMPGCGLYRIDMQILQATDDALIFAARSNKPELTADKRSQLLGLLSVKDMAGCHPSPTDPRDRAVNLAVLSNLSPKMLQGCASCRHKRTVRPCAEYGRRKEI